MKTHYCKHHATYVKTINEFAEKAGLQGKTVEEILLNHDSVADEAALKGLRDHGGYYTHNLYFSTLSPNAAKAPVGKLADKANEIFGSLDEVIDKLSKAAIG